MKKSDLRTGHIVTLRNGQEYIVMLQTTCSTRNATDILLGTDKQTWQDLADYNEDMKMIDWERPNSEWDIVAVEQVDYFTELRNIPAFPKCLWYER